MAIREKLRKTFGKGRESSSGGSTPSKGSTDQYYTGRTDIEYYKPHEIPKSKYRGRVDKAHQEQLESYSFTDAFATIRRKSSQALSGIMSPGGTKSQSRRPSYMSRASHRTGGSVASQGGLDGEEHNNFSQCTTPGVERVDEVSDEDNSLKTSTTSTQHVSQENVPTVRLDRTATETEDKPQFDHPFTVTDLEKAMTKATLRGNNDPLLHRSSIAAH